MTLLSRRSFLTSSAIAVSSALVSRAIPFSDLGSGPLHMLVVGDSVMWGQGLSGTKKYWYLTQRWIETEACRGRRVEAHIEAHSGATIIDKNRTPKIDRLRKFYGEINIGTPTIEQQLKDAVQHYTDRRIDPHSVELILMNGGANDVGIFQLVNPSVSLAALQKEMDQTFGVSMRGLLAQAATSFPNARIVVTGYYPIISELSDTQYACFLGKTIFGIEKYEKILNAFLGIFGRSVSICLTTFVLRRLRDYKAQLVQLSQSWYRQSNEKLAEAVRDLNAARPLTGAPQLCDGRVVPDTTTRAYFAPVVFKPENSFATSADIDAEKNPSYLWRIIDVKSLKTELDDLLEKKNCSELKPFDRRILTNDEMYETRQAYCKCRDLGYKKLDLEMCHAAGTGHPNVKGAREFARAIKYALTSDPLYAPAETV